MNPLVLHHNLGLGDHIICNGLVRSLLNDGKHFTDVFIFCKERNLSPVSFMYSDEKRIHVVSIPNDPNVEWHIVNSFIVNNPNLQAFIRAQNCVIDNLKQMGIVSTWDEGFYICCGIPFQKRWDSFKIFRDMERETALKKKLNLMDGDRFVLVHNQGSWGGKYELNINSDTKKIFVEPLTDNMFDWLGVAEEAEEVHCIDSSFIHAAQCMKIKRGFFHNIRPAPPFRMNPSWTLVDYSTKQEN